MKAGSADDVLTSRHLMLATSVRLFCMELLIDLMNGPDDLMQLCLISAVVSTVEICSGFVVIFHSLRMIRGATGTRSVLTSHESEQRQKEWIDLLMGFSFEE